MIIYSASLYNLKVQPIEVERVTESCYFIKGGNKERRINLSSENRSCFIERQDAIKWLHKTLEIRLRIAEHQLKVATGNLSKFKESHEL